jgi:hypothetical protein
MQVVIYVTLGLLYVRVWLTNMCTGELSVTDVFLDWQKISKNILEKRFDILWLYLWKLVFVSKIWNIAILLGENVFSLKLNILSIKNQDFYIN